jgi:hypothetical protein
MLHSRKWDRLTPDQKELALSIEAKWLNVARCTDRIDRQQATDAINTLYLALVGKAPRIIFADSPPAVIEMEKQRDKYTGQLSPDIYMVLRRIFKIRMRENLRGKFVDLRQPINTLQKIDGAYIRHSLDLTYISFQFWAYEAIFFDYACSIFGCYFAPEHLHLQEKWESLKLLATHCGFISPFQDICFVSDRPTELIFKDDFILHAVDRPAVIFRDGYKIYFEDGVELSASF